MKQILQNLGSGETELAEIAAPEIVDGSLLIATSHSLVSPGTERMLVDFGKANLLDKARQQPDKVKMVFEKIRTDGLLPTIATVRNKLDQSIPLGYCNVGEVIEVGTGVAGIQVGDRVASNGHHAEIVRVPKNLCAKVPEGVSDETAAFTVIGAIALQGIRLVQPTLGEVVVVTGLGLVGLITVQLLRAQGCRVIGIDLDTGKVQLARQFGAETVDLSSGEDPLTVAESVSRGRGVDAVIITAATNSSEPVSQAAKMCRKRGRIVLVGVTGLELSRADFFEKELTFQVSCSYGPGRYDTAYEEKGNDYPVGFVRWTEQRNMEAVLDMMATGALNMTPLISHRFKFDDAIAAYDLLGRKEPSLGILLEYDKSSGSSVPRTSVNLQSTANRLTAKVVLGFIGAGNYAGNVLIPVFGATGARMKMVSSSNGVTGNHVGKKYGIEVATTSSQSLIDDDEVNTVVIATRHDSHAAFVLAALTAGKHVFVEKPLCITHEQLNKITNCYSDLASAGPAPLLMVGFNRRFSPQVVRVKGLLLRTSQPKAFVMTVNAGPIPADHWTQDPVVGGGRIVGEACHFIDLLRYLAGSEIARHNMAVMRSNGIDVMQDTVTITLTFADGSIGTIHYFANGNNSLPKERLEVFCAGGVLQLDNFRKLKGFGWPGFGKMNLIKQDKGQRACVAAFINTIETAGQSPIPMEEIIEVSRVSIELAESV